MIISASRRTDIPTFYSTWLFNRLREEYVYVRNPMSVHQVSKVNLSPSVVDGIVFWTKNPIPMLKRINELEKYNFYFQFTLNPYGKDVEPNVPTKNDTIIPAFIELSQKIGRERVIWRYDPILFNQYYTMDYHRKYFRKLASILSAYTEKCTVSFLDLYRKTERNIMPLQIIPETHEQQLDLMFSFSEIAKEYGIYIDTCAEAIDLSGLQIAHACCIDKDRFERLGNYKLSLEKDKNQRPECGCIASVDIGAYNTCRNGCLYCYANYSNTAVQKASAKHNPDSPLLFGEIEPDDVINERNVQSNKLLQTSLFDI